MGKDGSIWQLFVLCLLARKGTLSPSASFYSIVWDTPGKEKVAKWSFAPASSLEGFNEIYAVCGPKNPYTTREKRQSCLIDPCLPPYLYMGPPRNPWPHNLLMVGACFLQIQEELQAQREFLGEGGGLRTPNFLMLTFWACSVYTSATPFSRTVCLDWILLFPWAGLPRDVLKMLVPLDSSN